ncbi:MAG: DUF134 domain-containing protein [bacterium]|jgi:predicted DNA-binding protein (UPF0251 family)
MARPCFRRQIGNGPTVTQFNPSGSADNSEDFVTLSLDEFEAIRLADLQGQYHEQAGEEMGISRATFGRILENARKKLAQVLVEGRPLRIEGGVVEVSETRQFHCAACKHNWELPFGTGRPAECPQCQSQNFHRADRGKGCGRGNCMGRGRGFRQGQSAIAIKD